MDSSKDSAIRRRRLFQGSTTAVARIRVHSIWRSILAASRTSRRRPGRRSSARGFDTELGGKPFHFTAGVRRESTDVSSSGVGRLPILLTVNPADPTLLTTTFSESQPITTDSDYALPAAQPRHEAGADGRIAPAVRCLAHADAAGDQLPDAGAQRRCIAAHRRADGHGRQPGAEAVPVRQPRPRGRVVLRQELVLLGQCVHEGRDQLHRAGNAASDDQRRHRSDAPASRPSTRCRSA